MAEWTEERRKRQAEVINRCKPWEKSTGPRTRRGKERSSRNALKTGSYSRSQRKIRKALRRSGDFIEAMHQYFLMQHVEAMSVRRTALAQRLENKLLKNAGKSGF